MDPITGIGLAASLVQIVQFTLNIATRYRDIYLHGLPDGYIAIDDTVQQLTNVTESLQQSLKSSIPPGNTFSQDEKDLYELSRKCEDCAKQLLAELRKLKADPKVSSTQIIRRVSRSIWKKDKIRKIKEQLEEYRSILQTSLLYRLSERFDTQSLRHSDSFKDLDTQLQHIVTCLAASRTSLEDLTMHESEQTRQHISAEVASLDQRYNNVSVYDQTIQTLIYPDIFLRQEQSQLIAYGNSYDFSFHEPDGYKVAWSSFVNWLKSGNEVYWINGKAGSGKSTLMKYVCGHHRQQELLKAWHPTRQLLTPNFFFWAAGSPLQRSITGLLQSLIYQSLMSCPDLLKYCEVRQPHDLTEQRLSSALLRLLLQDEVPLAVCLFIDDLDEFEGSKDLILELINRLSNSSFVKACVSSRPLHMFEKAFKYSPGLRLQDLTHNSIQAYVQAKLSELPEVEMMEKSYKEQVSNIINKIVYRADGVFLWAVLVVKEVREGLQSEASMIELETMIASRPSELEALLLSMLNQIKQSYRQDAARFLQIALQARENLDLCGLHLTSEQKDVSDAPLEYEKIPVQELVKECTKISIRLLSHTAGLLELTRQDPQDDLYSLPLDDRQYLLCFQKISFIHRTAQDFLLKNEEAKLFFQQYGSFKAAINISLARGLLTRIAQGLPLDPLCINRVYFVFREALLHVSEAENITGQAQTTLIDSLDYKRLAYDYRPDEIKKEKWNIFIEPWMVSIAADGIDLVGTAASVGMTLYVCSKLKLAISACEDSPTPDLRLSRDPCRLRPFNVLMKWPQIYGSDGKGTMDISGRIEISRISQRLHCQDYPSEIMSYLELPSDYGEDQSQMVLTYLLSCCAQNSPSLERCKLTRVLLRAGANAMVGFKREWHNGEYTNPSSWQNWLEALLNMRWNYMEVHGKSGNIMLPDKLTIADIGYTTQAFLNSSVDLNLMLRSRSVCETFLKRRDLEFEDLDFMVSASAGFILQECFGQMPEFYESYKLPKDMNSSVKRKLSAIVVKNLEDKRHYDCTPQLTLEDNCESVFWPLIEKWEKSRRRTDLDALLASMKAYSEENRSNIVSPIEDEIN